MVYSTTMVKLGMLDPIAGSQRGVSPCSQDKMLEVEVRIAAALEILNTHRMQTSCEVPGGGKPHIILSNGKISQLGTPT